VHRLLAADHTAEQLDRSVRADTSLMFMLVCVPEPVCQT